LQSSPPHADRFSDLVHRFHRPEARWCPRRVEPERASRLHHARGIHQERFVRSGLETTRREREIGVVHPAHRSRRQRLRRSVPGAHEQDGRAGPVHVDRQIVADEHAPRGDRCERIRIRGRDAERRHDAAMIGRVGIAVHVDVGPTGLAHQRRSERFGGPLHQDPVDPVVDLVGDRLQGPGRRPREPGHRDGIRMDLSVRVTETRAGQRLGDGPGDRIPDLFADGIDGGRPIEMRRGVEVACEEHRDAARGQAGKDVELRLDRRQPCRTFKGEHGGTRLAVANPVRPVGVGRQMDVGDGDEPAGCHLGQGVHAVRPRRIDQGEPGDQLEPGLAEPAEHVGQPALVRRPFLQTDDVRVRGTDGRGDLRQGLRAAGR
jgi:hypothetical protein